MRVLVIESDPGSGADVEKSLRDGGHDVERCNEPHTAVFPCAAVASGVCPLDEPTDAVVAVRGHPHPRPTTGEIGVSCALREGVPLVVAGVHGLSPFAPWSTAVVEDGGDLEAAVASAALAAPPAVVSAARAEARRLLDENADVEVTRHGDRLSLSLSAPGVTDKHRLSNVAVQVLGAARQAARRATTMDIGIASDEPGGM